MNVCILRGPRAVQSVAERAVRALKDRGIDAWEADRDAAVSATAPRLKGTGLIITLGGDGTFLAGARLAAPRGIDRKSVV